MELLKETKVWRVPTEDIAIKLINDEKENAHGCTVTKNGYVIKTKKSKGEIVDSWCIVTIEYSYEV